VTTPSNPSVIPSLPVVGLLAVILFLGLALAPRAFQFRAWPEPPRQYASEQVVDRPVSDAPRIEVAGVEARGTRAERRGVEPVAGAERAAGRGRDEHSRAGDSKRAGSGRRGGHSSAPEAAPAVPDVVMEVPAPAQPVPVTPVPEEPAQLAEVPSADQVLRPDAPVVVPAVPPVRNVDLDENELDVVGVGGDDGDARNWRRHGHRGHRGHRGRGMGLGRGHKTR
jgi:hypothetical protein